MSEFNRLLSAILQTDVGHLEALAWLAFAAIWFGSCAAGALVLLVRDVIERA